MKMREQGLGYRELNIMADFMKKIAATGLGNDMPMVFSYNFMYDHAVCLTEKGRIITSDDEF